MNRKKRGSSPENLMEIKRLRDEGMSFHDIAMLFNVKEQTVRNWASLLKRQGVQGVLTSDKTKIDFMLHLLDIDIQEETVSIKKQCEKFTEKVMKNGVSEDNAKIMAQGVKIYLEDIVHKIK